MLQLDNVPGLHTRSEGFLESGGGGGGEGRTPVGTRHSLCGNPITSLRSRLLRALLCILSDPCEIADTCILSAQYGAHIYTYQVRGVPQVPEIYVCKTPPAFLQQHSSGARFPSACGLSCTRPLLYLVVLFIWAVNKACRTG